MPANSVPDAAVYRSRVYWSLFLLVLGVFAIQVFANYVGEEAVYTLTSIEMWHNSDWIRPILYGDYYDRPPAFNWLMIPLANAMGWEHVLIASRIIAITATVLIGFVLWLLARALMDSSERAWLTVLVFFSGDVLFVRGWLAYADPLFSLFVFTSLVSIYFAARRQQLALVLLAVVCLSLAFLTKAITAYTFYGAVVVVLFTQREYRAFLLHPAVIGLHLCALAFPVYWSVSISEGAHGKEMVAVIFEKFDSFEIQSYLGRLFFSYPLKVWSLFLPISLLAVLLIIKHRLFPTSIRSKEMVLWWWILLLSVLPYWLAPEGGKRYLMPVYPLFALLFSSIVWSYGADAVRLGVRLLGATVVLAYFWAVWVMPHYQMHHRGGDYAAVADRVIELVGDQNLATRDDSSTGLSVTAELNRKRHTRPPLTRPDTAFLDGFVINYTEDPAVGKTVEKFEFARNSMYLLCRGSACEHAADAASP